jgi:FkbM family methyltransferase
VDQQIRWYREVVKLDGQVIADVGANVGRLSEAFVQAAGSRGRVVSIEPLPDNIRTIEARMKKARAGKRWSLKKCAVSDRDGHLRMRRLKTSWGVNGVVVHDADAGESIPCRRLVSLVPDATVVKLDIEGHEHVVLPDALASMPAVTAWALELHRVADHPLEQTLGSLVDAGYELVGAGRRRDEPDGPWLAVPLLPTLSWDAIPGTTTVHDGLPDVFKMLHVIARRAGYSCAKATTL